MQEPIVWESTNLNRPSMRSLILNSNMIRILGTIFAGLLGLAFGSFLNVCLSRWPTGESIVRPRSHCRQCGRTLAWWENIPLISWLALRGRCRTCRAWIGWRYPLVELAVGALWAYIAWGSKEAFFPFRFDVGMMLLTWMLVGLAVLDAEHLWLPNVITLPGVALGFIAFFLRIKKSSDNVLSYYGALSLQKRFLFESSFRWLLGILAAAALILFIRWLYWLICRREGIGLGDAKLMAMLAAWLGLPGALLSFVLGVVLGTLVAVVLRLIPSARRDSDSWALSKLPLGTFLCIGGIVSSLWGQPIIAAYLRLAGF
jgi:leader peptidase (prepilin peptidase)/N-methyltransferase